MQCYAARQDSKKVWVKYMVTLKEAREARNITQAHLSSVLRLSIRCISRMENGYKVNRCNFLNVCEKIGVNPEEITGVNIARQKAKKDASN